MKSRISELFAIDKFKLAYWIIAIATGQHTAWGAARIMQGAQPPNDNWWWLQGIAFAIAIDYTMIMVAAKIRDGNKSNPKRYIAAFILTAILSFNFQLLYAWAHAEPLQQGGGVAINWVQTLQNWIDSQIVIVPSALPLVAIVYTIAGLGRGGEAQRRPQRDATPVQPRIEVSVEKLQAPLQPALPSGLQWHNGGYVERNGDTIVAYICPGCNKQLSIAGWSRHKKSCKLYVAAISNGHSEHVEV